MQTFYNLYSISHDLITFLPVMLHFCRDISSLLVSPYTDVYHEFYLSYLGYHLYLTVLYYGLNISLYQINA